MFFHSFVHCNSSQTLFFFQLQLPFNISTAPCLTIALKWTTVFIISIESALEIRDLIKIWWFLCCFYFLYHIWHTVIALPLVNVPLHFGPVSFYQYADRELNGSGQREREAKGKKNCKKNKWNFLHSKLLPLMQNTGQGYSCHDTDHKMKGKEIEERPDSAQIYSGASSTKGGHKMGSQEAWRNMSEKENLQKNRHFSRVMTLIFSIIHMQGCNLADIQ